MNFSGVPPMRHAGNLGFTVSRPGLMSTQSGVVPVHNAMVPTSNGLMVPGALMTSGHNVIPAEGGGIFPDNTPFSQGEFVTNKHVLVDGGNQFFPSAVHFDTAEELLWMGNQGGHVTSYYGQGLQKYTSFQVHEIATDTRQLLTVDHNVLCLFRDSVRCWSKYGVRQFVHTSPNILESQCMLLTSNSSLLFGGHQQMLVELDLKTVQETRQTKITTNDCTILRRSNSYICSGDTSGKVTLRDPLTLKSQHQLQAHTGTLSDFDINGHQLITCGFANRMGSLHIDRFLMVYDMRTLRALPPMQVNVEPMFLRCIPVTNRVAMVSQSGQFQVMDQGAMTPESMVLYQVENHGAPIMSFDLSATCDAMAFGDSAGYLHLYTKGMETKFNRDSTETAFPPTMFPHTPIHIRDIFTPYSSIPMVYPSGGVKLSSDWPAEYCRTVYRKMLPIEPEILRTTQLVQNIGHAPNPGTRRRNQCMYKLNDENQSASKTKAAVEPDSPMGTGEDPWQIAIPKKYCKVEIKYSKLGVEDFDFLRYNKTNFAGLETHIPNAYCNAMLQVMYFIEPIRCNLLSHLCRKEFCLACEIGFLFHMLDLQKGKTCQASNFLRAFRTIPEASALGLVLNDHEESMGKQNLPRLIQSWSRFIMQQIHAELVDADKHKDCPESPFDIERSTLTSSMDSTTGPLSAQALAHARAERKISDSVVLIPESPTEAAAHAVSTDAGASTSIVTQIFGCELSNNFKCRCGHLQSREMTSCILDLNYNVNGARIFNSPSETQTIPTYSFAEIIQRSLCRDQQTQAWCPRCSNYQPHLQSRDIKSIPEMLVLNCHLESVRDFEFWLAQEQYARKHDVAPSPGSADVSALSYSSRTSLKMCRYGKGCTRKDCKFRHEGDFASVPHDDIGSVEETAWVPFYLRIQLHEHGEVVVTEIREESELFDAQPEGDVSLYELYATVVHIDNHRTCGNVVANVNVGGPYHKRKQAKSQADSASKTQLTPPAQWYLLNDFSISPIQRNVPVYDCQEEAVHFSLDWKVPCIILFKKLKIPEDIYPDAAPDISDADMVTNPITVESLRFGQSLVETPRRRSMTFTPLGDDELPTEGAIVGLDAEFVTLNQEVAELRSDGTRATLKPSQLSLARVTCVRGWETLFGEPFIDDYISTQEQVVDYLTQFSGIKPGDLDANVSAKHLTSLKSTYMKLRYLVDLGVVFVGHGLKKDFRVINIVVPKDQIIDTVELFHLPKQRMISLRFLAWYFLDQTIQSTTHDSVEDARTALQLYREHQRLSAGDGGAEKFRTILKELYDKGRTLKWKIPVERTESEEVAVTDKFELDLQEIM